MWRVGMGWIPEWHTSILILLRNAFRIQVPYYNVESGVVN